MGHIRNECLDCEKSIARFEYSCPKCGGNNIVDIRTCECEYCGWREEQDVKEPCPQCGLKMREVDD